MTGSLQTRDSSSQCMLGILSQPWDIFVGSIISAFIGNFTLSDRQKSGNTKSH